MLEIVPDGEAFVAYLTVYARWSVGSLLLMTGLLKLCNMKEFVSTVEAFRVVPRRLAKHVTWIVVLSELTTGTSLLLGAGTRVAAAAASVLFFCFAIAIGINLARKNILNCNCFGPYFSDRISVRSILRNLILIALCMFIFRFYDGYLAVDGWLPGVTSGESHSLAGFALVTASLVLGTFISISTMTIVSNFRLVLRRS